MAGLTDPSAVGAPEDPTGTSLGPSALTVVYDETCELCQRCRDWLELEPTWVPLTFVAAGSTAAQQRWADLPWLGADLVVVGDHGEAWIGPAAFLVCLWATKAYRPWAFTMSGKALAPMAERFFAMVSHQRGRINGLIRRDCGDGRCRRHPRPLPPPRWPGGPWPPP